MCFKKSFQIQLNFWAKKKNSQHFFSYNVDALMLKLASIWFALPTLYWKFYRRVINGKELNFIFLKLCTTQISVWNNIKNICDYLFTFSFFFPSTTRVTSIKLFSVHFFHMTVRYCLCSVCFSRSYVQLDCWLNEIQSEFKARTIKKINLVVYLGHSWTVHKIV